MQKQKTKDEMTCYEACVEYHDKMLAEAVSSSKGKYREYKESALALAIKGLLV